MNTLKFSLADLITLLTALIFGFVCYLGINFETLGNIYRSLLLAAIIIVLLGGTALGVKLLKRTSKNFMICLVWEMILLVFFTGLLTFFSYRYFPHYFVVLKQRTEIKGKLTESIIQTEKMFEAYEHYMENRENLFRSKLHSVVAAKKTNPSEYVAYGFKYNSVSDNRQIDNKMFTIHADLFLTNYEEMKQPCLDWLTDARSTINNWWAWNLGVVDIVNNVESNSNAWLNSLIEFSSFREKGEIADDFTYNLSFDDVKKHFTSIGAPTPLSIGLAVLSFVLMLFSWIITERHTKFPGFKYLFKRNKTEKEL